MSLRFPFFVLSIVCAPAIFGQSPGSLPIRPKGHFVYDLARNRALRGAAPTKRAVASYCYVNTDTAGFTFLPDPVEELIDWGILGGTMTTKCAGLSPIVTNFDFAYATSTTDTSAGGPGAALTLTFYTGYSGFGDDSGNCPVATFSFAGLPGFSGSSTGFGVAYFVSVDVTGGGEFLMPDGKFGYGYRGDGNTGPLLCLTGDGAGGAEPSTGNVDRFDVWVPDTKGVHAFTWGGLCGPPCNFASWHGSLARAHLASSPAMVQTRSIAPNPPNSLMCSAARLGENLEATLVCPPGYTSGFFFAFDTPIQLVLSGGQVLLCLDLGGSGELLTGGGQSGTAAGTLGGSPAFTLKTPMPLNVDFCGFTMTLQGLCAFGVTPFALTSACDLTLGG